jgi:hypothetical protein
VSGFGVQRRSGDRHKRPWITRWSVGGRQGSRSFRTKMEAKRLRSAWLVAFSRERCSTYPPASRCRGNHCLSRCGHTRGPASGWPSSGPSGRPELGSRRSRR